MSTRTWTDRIVAAAGSLLLCAGFVGCGGKYDVDLRPAPVQHMVAFGKGGYAVDPTGCKGCKVQTIGGLEYCDGRASAGPSVQWGNDTSPGSAYGQHLENIFTALSDSGKQQILVFVHGGLGSRQKRLRLSKALEPHVAEAGYFPIFVNWRSSLRSSYTDHLLWLRQGKVAKNGYVLLSPFYLLADVVRAVARAPMVWSQGLKNTMRNRRGSAARKRVDAEAARLEEELGDNFWESAECGGRGAGEKWCRWGPAPITVPLKMVTGPFIDAIGSSAWDVMLRRTDTLFYDDDYFRKGFAPDRVPDRPDGGLGVFFDALGEELERLERRDGKRFEITLVGHSMGAIVVDNIVRLFGDRLPIRNIVYMAAANPLRSYQETVIPYARDREVEIFHLTLGRSAELWDRNAWDVAPRGTLLAWIDDFLHEPRFTLDRTTGQFWNLSRVARIPLKLDGPSSLRERIYYKVYGSGQCVKDRHPQKHGDFSQRFAFWRPECWKEYPDEFSSEANHCFLSKPVTH